MHSLIKRLLTTTAAYQVGDVVSKVFAVALLPVYTRHVSEADYGIAELLMTAIVLFSILVRLGIGEAFVRYHYVDEDQERRDALARRAIGFLLVATTLVAIPLAIFAGPLSELVLGYRDAGRLPRRRARPVGVHEPRAGLRAAARRRARPRVRARRRSPTSC